MKRFRIADFGLRIGPTAILVMALALAGAPTGLAEESPPLVDAMWDLVPERLPRLGLPDTDLMVSGGPPPSPLRVIACAEDSTTTGAAIRYWTTALKHKDPRFRSLAARALGEMRDQAAVPALIEALKDAAADVRLTAVQALGRIGREAEPAVPALREALKDEDQTVQAEVARTLEKIQHPR